MTEVSDQRAAARQNERPSASSRRRARADTTTFLDEHPQTWNLVLEALPDGTALIDNQGVMRYVNATLTSISGYSREELVGQSVLLLVPERLRGLEDSARRHNARNPETPLIWSDQDLSLLHRDGREIPVDFALSTLEIDGVSWAVAAVRDASARRAGEAARADVELRFRVAFENNMAPMSFTDVHDRIIAVNDAFCEMIGFSRDELHRPGLDALHLPRGRRDHREHAPARDHRRAGAGALPQALPAQGRPRHRRRGVALPRARRDRARSSTSSSPSATSPRSAPSPPSSRTAPCTTR